VTTRDALVFLASFAAFVVLMLVAVLWIGRHK